MTMKEAKMNFITDVAAALFAEKSVMDVTMKDIAVRAGVGEATVYRYFARKKNVVLAVAEKLERQVYEEYFSPRGGKSGYGQIQDFFDGYEKIFSEHPDYYKFVGEFDAYVLSEGGASSETYASGVDLFRNAFTEAYNAGVADGSVRDVGDVELFYYAAAHAMLELCKKLCAGQIIRQDQTTDKVAEIGKLKEIILFSLAAPLA